MTGRGIDLDYCDTEWLAFKMNRDHSVISLTHCAVDMKTASPVDMGAKLWERFHVSNNAIFFFILSNESIAVYIIDIII